MIKFEVEAPWYVFQKKVKALFDRDPEITVGEVFPVDNDDTVDYGLIILVRNHDKYVALDRVMPKERSFGNVTLGIQLLDEEKNNAVDDGIALYTTLFKGNPVVKDIKDVSDFTGTRHGFVRFRPEVIQFFHDDISDYNGNWSGLAQDIAREVFTDGFQIIHFCTAGLNENEAGEIIGEPLGEWP